MERSPIKHLKEKEGIAAIFFLVFCTVLSLKFPAGVGTSNQAPFVGHASAPWIFGPFQVLLLYLPPWLGVIAFPLIIIGGLAALPWIVNYWGVKRGQRIFIFLFGLVIILLIWFKIQELWWT